MISHIALLRGVNVGANMLKMERLREIFAELGHHGAKTFLQSGNVLFTARGTAADLSARIEEKVNRVTWLPVSVIIRTPAQLKRVVVANPFLKAGGADAKTLHVTFLGGAAPKAGLDQLGKVRSGEDRWQASGREIYLCCPNGYGRSNLNNGAIERLTGMRATTRNWNTVTALSAMASEQ